MVRPTSRIAGALATAALALALAACQSGGDARSEASPTTSASEESPQSPTPDPSEAAIDERAADAEQRFREFLEIRDDYAKKGKDPFEDLLNNGYLGTAEVQKGEQSLWAQYTELGLKQVGSMRVTAVETTEYEGDPFDDEITGHRVHLQVCMDSSDYDVVRPDGSSAVEESPSREVRRVVMQGQPTGLWSLSGYASAMGSC